MTSLYVGTIGMSTWYSEDLGNTLLRLRSDSGLYSESRVWALAAHPERPNEVLAGTDSGVYRLDRANSKWVHLPSEMDNLHVWSIAYARADPKVVLAGTCPSAVFRSTDGGQTWQRARGAFAETCTAVLRPRITQIIIDPRDSNAAWASIEVDGVWRSRDGGQSWEKCSKGIVSEDCHGINLMHRDGKRILFLTTNKGLHVSYDDGSNWAHRPLDTPWPYMRGVAPRADGSGVIFVGNGDSVPGSTGRLMRSRDYGETWGDAGLPGELKSTPWCIATNAADPNLIFVSTCFGKYYRSTDGGESWERLERELGETRALLWLPN